MKNKKGRYKNLFILILIVVAAGLAALKYSKKQQVENALPPKDNAYKPNAPDFVQPDQVLINVPFTSQAPLGHWEDLRQEDGCEEASLLMAWLWINSKTISPADAEKEIIAISEFEEQTYGNYHDTSAADTTKILVDYYHYEKFKVAMDPTIADIKKALTEGKIVLVPANGQKLNNPFYKQPGPLTHMLVIKGFRDKDQIFITNDPGTRRGEGFEFSYNTVYNAMVDYPSGNHLSQVGRSKAMIVIEK